MLRISESLQGTSLISQSNKILAGFVLRKAATATTSVVTTVLVDPVSTVKRREGQGHPLLISETNIETGQCALNSSELEGVNNILPEHEIFEPAKGSTATDFFLFAVWSLFGLRANRMLRFLVQLDRSG